MGYEKRKEENILRGGKWEWQGLHMEERNGKKKRCNDISVKSGERRGMRGLLKNQ